MGNTSRNACVGCGEESPETETNFTLISARHGWRLARRTAIVVDRGSATGELLAHVEATFPRCRVVALA